jgi:hypothetical protein
MSDNDEFLEIEVAGTTITLGRNECALAIYADCKFRGEQVNIYVYSGGFELTNHIIERKVGDASICAAIFPRIPTSSYSNTNKVCLWGSASKAKFKFGSDEYVTVYAGNVTEAYLKEK